MDTFWLLASGGSTVEEFAKDVYLKSNLTNRIGLFIKQLLVDVYGHDEDSAVGGVIDEIGSGSTIESKIITEVSSPAVNSLVNCFEAAFLHGLKGKPLFNRVIGKSSPKDSSQSEYRSDFWSVILILSHNQVSESLGQLNNIRSDIGRCRAWLRLTLNDGLLRSYLEALINDTSLLHGFYRPSAYLRDKEHMDSLRKLMEPLKNAKFQLNYDHYLLNNWTCDTLKLIGITLQDTAPVVAAVDALSTIGNSPKTGQSSSSSSTSSKKKDLLRKRLLDRRDNGLNLNVTSPEALKTPNTSSSDFNSDQASSIAEQQNYSCSTNELLSPMEKITIKIEQSNQGNDTTADASSQDHSSIIKFNSNSLNKEETSSNLIQQEVQRNHSVTSPRERDLSPSSINLDEASSLHLPSSYANSDSISFGGNSISNKGGWSTSPPEGEEEPYENLLYSISTNAMLSSTPDIKEFIFSPLSNDDNRSIVSNGSEGSPRAQNVESGLRRDSLGSRGLGLFKRKKSFQTSSNRTKTGATNVETVGSPGSNQLTLTNGGNDFEIIPKTMVLNSQEPETQEFLLHLTKIANHIGLDEQDYKCYSCGRPIGMIYGKFRVCEFDGFNYCTECHTDEKWLIPAKIVNNWDFKKYPVANRNKKRLQLIESEPLIDIKVSAPLLYNVVKELQEILDLRTQLFYLHAYLFTCKEQIATGLRRILWPRDHLYEHIHLYSTSDLLQVQSGTSLANLLKKAIQFARKHVLSCILCSQKGFICELCKSPQIIYPFDTDITYRCDNCKAVFHITCFITDSGKRPCPRCLRIRRRERAAVTV